METACPSTLMIEINHVTCGKEKSHAGIDVGKMIAENTAGLLPDLVNNPHADAAMINVAAIDIALNIAVDQVL